MKKLDAQDASKLAVEVAAREIQRLANQTKLSGWDSAELERYAGICTRHDNHVLTWLNKLDPTKLSEELVARVLKDDEEGEADGARSKRKPRAGA